MRQRQPTRTRLMPPDARRARSAAERNGEAGRGVRGVRAVRACLPGRENQLVAFDVHSHSGVLDRIRVCKSNERRRPTHSLLLLGFERQALHHFADFVSCRCRSRLSYSYASASRHKLHGNTRCAHLVRQRERAERNAG